ncbi:glutamyl-tRNA reductase [Pseudacidovorax sp. RU35E]|uniref:glutamyl-tRNA reductase n=1 Tax=Pseudacidovorax sp. RU35E TaxID=1907403 RepID=UPI00095462ED|nr:glutamyl-tRNA reductase [Pseudacidovorax sp. RU35E]SIR60534.1 glutamyl-tRNA reductase [Pseudacidovorax sp. RU35E]
MSLMALGLNHASAPLDLRGRFAIPADRLGGRLQALRAHLAAVDSPASGLAILSTCNRTELYLGLAPQAEPQPALLEPVVAWLAEEGASSPEAVRAHSYQLQGEGVARHAFRVAAGLDSMVLGEPQILGQLKQAVREAEGVGVLGPTLQQLFQRSFSVAKAVRSGTEIGAHAVSMAAAALRIAQQLYGDIGQRRVLFIGAGEMIELVATHFAAQAPQQIAVANRSAERGAELAARLGAQLLPLRGLDLRLGEFDIVVSCTASSLPLIGLGAVKRALAARRREPMLMIDLAVPRDIEADVAGLEDVYLYTVDDLARHVQQGGARRQAAVQQAEALVDAGVHRFSQWLEQRCSVPLILALRERSEQWRQLELERARRALARGEDVEQVLEQLSGSLSAKMMHGALAGLHASRGADHRDWAAAARRCFLGEGSAPH